MGHGSTATHTTKNVVEAVLQNHILHDVYNVHVDQSLSTGLETGKQVMQRKRWLF